MDGLLVFEKLLNQPVFCSLPFPPAAIFNDHQRIDSLLSRPFHIVSGAASPLLSQRARIPTKQQRSACAGSYNESIMHGSVEVGGSLKRKAFELRGDIYLYISG
jgi:hypothetical protein